MPVNYSKRSLASRCRFATSLLLERLPQSIDAIRTLNKDRNQTRIASPKPDVKTKAKRRRPDRARAQNL
jgi:hypothetical protein